MNKQVPRGDEACICPFHKKPMSEVCHKCPLWIEVKGKNPQSDESIREWRCAFAWLPMLLIENAQMERQTGKAVESFRNETVKFQEQSVAREEQFKRGLLGRALAGKLARPEPTMIGESAMEVLNTDQDQAER